jgi:hypothetical protein
MNNREVVSNWHIYGYGDSIAASKYPMSVDIGRCTGSTTDTVRKLASCSMGTGHDQFLTGIIVQFDLTFSNKAWVEAERYHFLDFVSSQSTMHRAAQFGIEEQVGGGREILVYGITPEFLLAHPELRRADVPTWARLVHEAGGVIFQAHPYRHRSYISTPGPHPDLALLDGIEVYNAGNTPEDNQDAALLRERKSLAAVAGSDGHSTASAGRAGILSPRRLPTEQDLAALLKRGEQKIYVG